MVKSKIKKEVLGYPAPKKASNSAFHDLKCPFTGSLGVKNEILKGIVIKKDTGKSATIQWDRPYFVPKYERYEQRRSRLRVHNPPCLDAQIGDQVIVARTRPLSKTKNHVIIHILSNEELGTASKTKSEKKVEEAKEPKQTEENKK